MPRTVFAHKTAIDFQYRKGRCEWCQETRMLAYEMFPWGAEPVPVPVCAVCFYGTTRKQHPSYRHFTLWGMAYAIAARTGLPFSVHHSHLELKYPVTCNESTFVLAYHYPDEDRPLGPATAIPVPIVRATGYVPRNIRIVARGSKSGKIVDEGVDAGKIFLPTSDGADVGVGKCSWGPHTRRYTLVTAGGAPVVVPVCKACYQTRTNSPRSDPKFRLWAWAYLDSRRSGLEFDIFVQNIKKVPRCPVTGDGLFYGEPHADDPERGRYAVLWPIERERGYVKENIQVISLAAAGVSSPGMMCVPGGGEELEGLTI